MQAAYADLEIAPDALPLAQQLAGQVLSLPMGPQLELENARIVADLCRSAV
jgi:dTDP-4-amino-4,6-dideoxygalactose transaminase